jgi:beta-glucosidase
MQFPSEFIWGVATSSYQIEGAWNVDGKGESIWDRFSHTPGNITNNDTGDIACDHYHRWREDVELMSSLGILAYRFSISWPRILPKGTGAINQVGLDHYSALVDALLQAGIEPFVNLYHWELPQVLQDQGGWPARPTAEGFANYAHVVSQHLGDRVRHWITLNEPYISAYVGYLEGRHAPGHRDLDEMVAASHHLLLAHGMAVAAIRANVPGAEVAVVLNLHPVHPASPSDADQDAARIIDGSINRWYLDPLARHGYPEDMLQEYGQAMDFVLEGDLETIATPLDYLGVNYYTRSIARSEKIPEEKNAPRQIPEPKDVTEMDWEIYPAGLFEILERLHREYAFPGLMVTENGAAFADRWSSSGSVEDPERIRYLEAHVREVARALHAGIPVRGYFAWSFLDNFEWAHGYSKRFGLVYVDYQTLKRIPKRSAYWFTEVISSNHLPTQS